MGTLFDIGVERVDVGAIGVFLLLVQYLGALFV